MSGQTNRIIVAVLLTLLAPIIAGQRDAPERIDVLAIGATLPQMTPVVLWLTQEPLTRVAHVPNRGFGTHLPPEEYQRLVRIYFPRTYQVLTRHDVLLFVGGCVQYMNPVQVSWLGRAVSDEGLGALGDLGGVSTTEEIVMTWISSGMWEIFPNDAPEVVTRGEWSQGPFWVRVSPGKENNPIDPFVDLDIEGVPGDQGRLIVPREGSTIYGEMRGISFKGFDDPPFLAAWNYGNGRTMLVAEFFNHPWFHSPSQGGENPYAQDVFVNMLLNVVGRPVFQEILILHAVRMGIQDFHQRYTLVLATLDFVERFDANTNSIRSDLAGALQVKELASQKYLELDIGGSMANLELSIEMANELMARALDLKNRAFLWIYIIEWFFVTGTLMASGTLLYTVMVKRMLYREAVHTKLRSRG